MLMVFYSNAWLHLKESFTIANYNPTTKVSVIIPARNEETNIGNCLQAILAQQFPQDLLEIIVVNDHSTDETLNVVEKFHSSIIKVIDLEKELANAPILNSYKKKAIELAIATSTGDLIVTTDADCIMSKFWLQSLVQCFEKNNAVFIAAPVAYISTNSIFNIFQSIDFMTMQGITGASVSKHFNTTCNGANLAYSKSAFYAVNGFEGIDAIASGDDMLLMHKIEKQFNRQSVYLKNKNAIVYTHAMPTLKEFFYQRIRWASKATHYTDKRVSYVLAMVYLYNLCLLAVLILGFFKTAFLGIFIMAITVKIFSELLLIVPTSNFFNKKHQLIYFIPLQIVHVIYMVVAGFLGQFTTYTWKDRQVK